MSPPSRPGHPLHASEQRVSPRRTINAAPSILPPPSEPETPQPAHGSAPSVAASGCRPCPRSAPPRRAASVPRSPRRPRSTPRPPAALRARNPTIRAWVGPAFGGERVSPMSQVGPAAPRRAAPPQSPAHPAARAQPRALHPPAAVRARNPTTSAWVGPACGGSGCLSRELWRGPENGRFGPNPLQ